MSQLSSVILGSGGAGPILTLTGNSGGAVPPTAGNINIVGSGVLTVAGNPGTSTLTISASGAVAQSFPTDAGTAIPAAGALTIAGGLNIGTTGAGSTVTVNLDLIVNLPNTNAGGTEGQYQLGGNRFVHNFGVENTFLGSNAGNLTLTSGVANSNTGVGFNALNALTTGAENTIIGFQGLTSLSTGNANTGFGYNTLIQISSGTGNTAVGHQSGNNYSTESNNIVLNNIGTIGDSGAIRIGTLGNQTSCFIAGIYNVAVGATAGVMMVDGTTNQLGSSNGTNGQLLIGGGTSPLWASLTSTGGTISFTAGANTLNLETSGISISTYTPVNTTPYVVLSTDQFLGVDSSGGIRTVQLPNAPVTGRVFAIKDSTGSAGTNNITVTTVGGVVTIDGGTSFVMNTAFQAIQVIYNGTNYEVF